MNEKFTDLIRKNDFQHKRKLSFKKSCQVTQHFSFSCPVFRNQAQ